MLQLSLGYVVQADREREVAEDLRNRQTLQPAREPQAPLSAGTGRPPALRRGQAQARVRGTGV